MRVTTFLSIAALGAVLAMGALVLLRDAEPTPAGLADAVPATARNVAGAPPAAAPTSVPASTGLRAVGVMVNGLLRDSTEQHDSLAFKGTFARTRMVGEHVRPEGGIIDLVNDECELEFFRDDRGTDLMPSERFFSAFEMMPDVDEDGGWIAVTLATDRAPTRGASRLDAGGHLALLVAQEKGEERAPVTLAADTEVSVGPFALQVTEVGPSDWNDDWNVTFQSSTDLGAVTSWSFVDSEGNAVELRPSMSMSGMGTWTQTLACDAPQTEGTLVLEFWRDARTVRVPFRVSGGLGL